MTVATVPTSTSSNVPAGSTFRPLVLHFPPDQPLTEDLLLELSARNETLRLERGTHGELVIMAPAGSESSARNALLTIRLGMWSLNDARGKLFDSSAGFTFPDGTVRSADAAWVLRERWEAIPREQQRKYAPLVPDFVAELRSPSDELGRLQAKLRAYAAHGVRLGWLIDPDRGVVEVYRAGREPETLDRPAHLSGEDVLPGLDLDLTGILTDD